MPGSSSECGVRLVIEHYGNTDVPRLRRMEVDVVDRRRFATQLGSIVIIDVVGLPIEKVEDIEIEFRPPVHLVRGAHGKVDRGLRALAVVLDQRPRAEIAHVAGHRPAAEIP